MTVIEAAAAVPDNAAPPPAVHFIGERRAYWRLLVRGAVLLMFTLGLYRFWFATDQRRFLWSHTEVSGETMEYTGTALELLIGFLIAIALLVPLNVLFFVVALNLGPVGQLISVLGFPILAFLGHFAVYRARRYRLTRTVYRGVRCHQGCSALRYSVCALFWWVMIALTLGLAYPFAQASLERFKMQNTYFGNLRGRFDGSGFRLFLRGLPMWLLVSAPLIFATAYAVATVEWGRVAAAASIASSADEFIAQLEGRFPAVYGAIVVAATAFSISLFMAVLLFPVFQAMMLRWWLSGLRLGDMIFRSHLRSSQIYGAYLRFLGYALLFSIVAIILAVVAFFAFGIVVGMYGKSEATEIIGAVAAVGFYVVVMLAFSTIYQGTVKLALWHSGVESLEILGLGQLDRVKAEGAPSSALGEGLADALNVGGF